MKPYRFSEKRPEDGEGAFLFGHGGWDLVCYSTEGMGTYGRWMKLTNGSYQMVIGWARPTDLWLPITFPEKPKGM